MLWVLALLRLPAPLGVAVLVVGSTDILDGILARRRGQTTSFGSQLDSVADHLLSASLVVWLLLLRPEFFRAHLAAILFWAALGSSALLIGWIRFGKLGDLHLYSAKAASLLAYLFAAHLLLWKEYSTAFFYLVLGACVLAALELIVVYLSRSAVDEHIGSVLLSHRSRKRPRQEP